MTQPASPAPNDLEVTTDSGVPQPHPKYSIDQWSISLLFVVTNGFLSEDQAEEQQGAK